ncbi:MFS transporter [Devosia sp. 2618]|uniref:MFS transporter n=1 Tax=Devosia sp. 2618 TaxID=3156454 RepID=UPI003393F238
MASIGASIENRSSTSAFIALSLATMLATVGTSIANIALPTLAETFSAPFAAVQWVVIAYLAALTLSVAVVGRLGDVFGLRPMYLMGVALFAFASLLCGLAPGLWFLVAARALQGIGAAFMMTLAMALMRQMASDGRVGRAMGTLGTVSALGTALGPALGGVLIATLGWRSIFLVQVLPALAALGLALVYVRRDEARGGVSAFDLAMLLDRKLAPNLIINVLVAAVIMTTLVVGPFYLGLGLGLDSIAVGLVMTVGPAISIASGLPSGWAVDRWGAGRLLVYGLMLMAGGAFLLAVLPNLLGVPGYVVAVAVLTPGYQLFQASNNTVVMTDVAKDRRGVASGLLGMSRNAGLIVGASAMGAVFAYGVGGGELARASSAAVAKGMGLTFGVAGVLMLLALTIVFAGRREAD